MSNIVEIELYTKEEEILIKSAERTMRKIENLISEYNTVQYLLLGIQDKKGANFIGKRNISRIKEIALQKIST